MMLWVEGTPDLCSNSPEEVEHFIDQYVSCSTTACADQLVALQKHKHSKTCKKTHETLPFQLSTGSIAKNCCNGTIGR